MSQVSSEPPNDLTAIIATAATSKVFMVDHTEEEFKKRRDSDDRSAELHSAVRSGTGVSPVCWSHDSHGRDARATTGLLVEPEVDQGVVLHDVRLGFEAQFARAFG